MAVLKATGPAALARLARRFRIVAFDWDGTAVMGRDDDATEVAGVFERLMAAGVWVVVITGTHIGHLTRPLARAMRSEFAPRLRFAMNRGSEIFGAADGGPILLSRREATGDENAALSRSAEALQASLADRGIETRVVYDRLNRRKVDLIPTLEWADPPKWRIGPLLDAVNARLEQGMIEGGLRELIDAAVGLARAEGLPDPRVTSDVKHIEIGLTDKSDSIAWMMREIADRERIAPEEILIAGDEFGPIGGAPGSDYKMVTDAVRGAVIVSVGREPNGLPEGVLHLAGGPSRFGDLVEQLAEIWEGSRAEGDPHASLSLAVDEPLEPGWRVVEEGIVPERERAIESILAVGNGFVATRASLAEGALHNSSPGTFLAGVFDLPAAEFDGPPVPELVVAPDWTVVRIFVEGKLLTLSPETFVESRRVLDMEQGISWRSWRHRDSSGRLTTVRGYRAASLADRHLLFQSLVLTPENWCGTIELEVAIETAPDRSGGLYAPRPRFRPTVTVPRGSLDGTLVGGWRTPSGRIGLVFGFRSRVQGPPGFAVERHVETTLDALVERWRFPVKLGQLYRFDRIAAVATEREASHEPPMARVERTLASVASVETATGRHLAAWQGRWGECGIKIEGDPEAERALRFAAYHLVAAANPDDESASIGARTLTGDAYKGHVFWDTEIYMLPFFIHTWPEAARALLMYRWRTLPAARAKARELGWRGAMYAWESADTGEEVTPRTMVAPDGEVLNIRCGVEEHHIVADVAYGVWQYWTATRDERFLLEAGAEIMIETARFWVSRAELEGDSRWHIRRVIGPDEYHETIDDNAYTNLMARWNLEAAAEAVAWTKERAPAAWAALSRRLAISSDEPHDWLEVAARMHIGFDPNTGLYEQFEGFFRCEPYDLTSLRAQGRWCVPLDLLLGRARLQRSQAVKQADVVMALHLLRDRIPPDVREANYRYYEPRTCHSSSLSPAIHALVAARIGALDEAMRYFQLAARIDLAPETGAAAGGVHGAALGGLWQAVVYGFLGMEVGEEGLRFDPHLPPGWRSLTVPLVWRGERIVASVKAPPGQGAERVPVELERGL